MKISPFSIENKLNSPISITYDCLANPYCIACADGPDSLDKKDQLIHLQFAEPIEIRTLNMYGTFADALHKFITDWGTNQTIIFNLYTTNIGLGESDTSYTSVPLRTSLVYNDLTQSVTFNFESLIDGITINEDNYILGDIYITKIPRPAL